MRIIISNPGSNSKKYSVYRDDKIEYSLYLDPDHRQCHVTKAPDEWAYCASFVSTTCRASRKKTETTIEMPSDVDGVNFLRFFLAKEGIDSAEIDAIMIRVVASGEYFTKDHLVDDYFMEKLNLLISLQRPLHAPIIRDEILDLRRVFGETSILAISDSAFHQSRPDESMYYAIDPVIADTYGIKRYGAHGLSMESIMQRIEMEYGTIPEKIVACHIGSGCSVTAIRSGKSVETTMGYSPLEGVMMGTRCGDLDVAAAIQLKRSMGWSVNTQLVQELNTNAGLLGVGGSKDFRDIAKKKTVEADENGKRPKLAYDKFVYEFVKAIGSMAAVMGGIDALVFSGTISERDPQIRADIVRNLDYLGFKIDSRKNVVNLNSPIFEISTDGEYLCYSSKPVHVVRIDEGEIVRQHGVALLK